MIHKQHVEIFTLINIIYFNFNNNNMKYTIILFLFILFVLHINCSCNENQVLFINDDNTTECKDCPSGCAICYRSIG